MKALIKFEQAFVEGAVFWIVKALQDGGDRLFARSFNTEKDFLYERHGDEKDFSGFFEKNFEKLGLKASFESIFSEFPLLDDSHVTIFVRSAFSRKQEGAELYVEGKSRTVVLGMQTERILYQGLLKTFLKHELLRVSDMLDPYFEYSPDAPLGGENDAENDLIRERFAALWNDYIHARLGDDVFPGFKLFTQGQLIATARDERSARHSKDGCFLCPLCGFPSFDRVGDWSGAERLRVAEAIQADRSDWDPSMDSCRQCFEMYHAQGVISHGRR